MIKNERLIRFLDDNITSILTKDFPPTFVADGNAPTFPNQTGEFSKKLTKLGIKNKLFLTIKNKIVNFMASASKATKIYNLKNSFSRRIDRPT